MAAPIDSSASQKPADVLSVLLADEMAATEALIAQQMESPVGLVPDIAHHLVDAGGKRLRPLLALASAALAGEVGPKAHALAAAVEFIHSATLLHDDVVDGSAMRRGQKAANLIWGNKGTILVGDFLFARAFCMMVATENLAILDKLSTASSKIAEGEVLQLSALATRDVSRQTYEKIIEAKTAILFEAACETGAMAAGANPSVANSLAAYGMALGRAFQYVDDALDYGGQTQALGKNIGDDFLEGKITLPVILAFERGTLEDRAFFEKMVSQSHSAADLPQALAILSRLDCIHETRQAALAAADEAKNHLEVALNGPHIGAKQAEIGALMSSLADFIVNRLT